MRGPFDEGPVLAGSQLNRPTPRWEWAAWLPGLTHGIGTHRSSRLEKPDLHTNRATILSSAMGMLRW